MLHIGWQFYSWFKNDVTPAYDESKDTGNKKRLCLDAISCNDPNATAICDQSDTSTKDALKAIGQTIPNAAFLPGTLGGGPLPTSIADVVSSEVQGALRN